MTEKPIIFSTEMVRAILEGRKTQTRRPIKGCHTYGTKRDVDPVFEDEFGLPKWMDQEDALWPLDITDCGMGPIKCPYDADRLWVRETWCFGEYFKEQGEIWYKEDQQDREDFIECGDKKWKSPIHMPRWASRINLCVKRIWVERLQDISRKDLRAELHQEFKDLWDSINKKRGYGWDTNPFVWAVEFEREAK
jgi:hypothetical protein